jgi:hypothetical protein
MLSPDGLMEVTSCREMISVLGDGEMSVGCLLDGLFLPVLVGKAWQASISLVNGMHDDVRVECKCI